MVMVGWLVGLLVCWWVCDGIGGGWWVGVCWWG